MDFNIPDAPAGETYEQELARVERCIPPRLRGVWLGLLGGDDEKEPGWPEMVATFMQLNDAAHQKTLITIAALYLMKLGGAMLMIQNRASAGSGVTPLAVCMASHDAAPLLAEGYKAAKLKAVLSSRQLQGDPLMSDYVERLKLLLNVADEAVGDLAEAAAAAEGDENPRLANKALHLGLAVKGVRELLEGQANG